MSERAIRAGFIGLIPDNTTFNDAVRIHERIARVEASAMEKSHAPAP